MTTAKAKRPAAAKAKRPTAAKVKRPTAAKSRKHVIRWKPSGGQPILEIEEEAKAFRNSPADVDLSDTVSGEPRTFAESGHPQDYLDGLDRDEDPGPLSAGDAPRVVKFARSEQARASAVVEAEQARRASTAGRRAALRDICTRLCTSIVDGARAEIKNTPRRTIAAKVASLPQTGKAIARAVRALIAAGFIPAPEETLRVLDAVQYDTVEMRTTFVRGVLRDYTGDPDLMGESFFKSLLTDRAKSQGRAKSTAERLTADLWRALATETRGRKRVQKSPSDSRSGE